MFDFTKEVVLNDLSLVSAVAGVALDIKRANKYLKGNTGTIYKQAGAAAVNEVGTITVPSGLTAGTYRFEVAVQTSGAYPITYDRWAINKGKPFYVEFAISATQATADNFATTALPLIKNGLKKNNGENIVDIVITKGTGTIVITAANEYLRFVDADITKLDTAGELFETVGATYVKTTAGAEGIGTAWTLTKNFRIPTQEATRFYGEDQDERPVSGVIYNQYTFQYNADRNFTGSGAVGQKVTSKTTHVYYVPSTLASTFEGYITTAFGAGKIVTASAAASAIADITFSAQTVSAATAVAGTLAGSFASFLADYSPAANVTYTLTAGTGDTNNALYTITGSELRTAGAVTAGTKAIRVTATDSNGNTVVEQFAPVVAA